MSMIDLEVSKQAVLRLILLF